MNVARRPTALLILGPALALFACRSDSPTQVVRALANASAAGSEAEVWRLLGPTTKARILVDARRATELSGRRALPPEELLGVGWAPPHFSASTIRERSRSGDHATVEVRGRAGEVTMLTCVRVDGVWTVELPLQ